VSFAKTAEAEPIDFPFGLWIGWAERSTSLIVFARWRQRAQLQSYLPGDANVPDDTLPCAVQKQQNQSICRLGSGLVWVLDSGGLKEAQVKSYSPAGTNVPSVPTWEGTLAALGNTIQLSVCGGDMVLCQITLTTCFHFGCSFGHPSYWHWRAGIEEAIPLLSAV